MGIKDKIRKLANLIDEVVEEHLAPEPSPPQPPPLPPRPPGMNRKQEPVMEYGALPKSFFNAVDSARRQTGYEPEPVEDEYHIYEKADPQPVPVRSKSQDRRGSPINFQRRPASTEFFRQQQRHAVRPPPSSPFIFRQQSVPVFPNHFQPMQQFDMSMGYYPAQFYPQPMYPMMFNQQYPWFAMQQPQIYPFY